MRKRFYSIWFRTVAVFFWVMVATCATIGLTVHLFNRYDMWRFLPFPLMSVHFVFVLAIVSTVFGSFLSMFALYHVLNPITELSRAMQKVALGDYAIRLKPCNSCIRGEIYDLQIDFNQMVQELGSIQTLHSDFISNVSHEFKTPLAAISGYATLLQDDTLSAEERNEYIEIIIKSTKELSRMTGNVLSLSRLENQAIIVEREYFRVDEQIRRIILRMEPVWSAKDLIIEPDLELINWHGNQELTAHIWNNLLDNAVKFTPPGGEIRITASTDGSWMSVVFRDSGIGMTPEVQTHIFDKFYQGDTSHKKKGNGLGLALVRKIVTLYGGTIHLESCPGRGSSFQILLPLDTDNESLPASTASSRAAVSAPRR